jgi:hypothetical protein
MSGKKTFTNTGKTDLIVRLLVRKGADPANGIVDRIDVPLKTGQSKEVTYGNSQNIYLQGIRLQWDDDGAQLRKRQVVSTRGCWLDDVLNTNSKITIGNVGRANITGSN